MRNQVLDALHRGQNILRRCQAGRDLRARALMTFSTLGRKDLRVEYRPRAREEHGRKQGLGQINAINASDINADGRTL